MKYLLYPIALLLCATSFAQTSTSKLASKLNLHRNKLLEQLLHQQMNQSAFKTTDLKERVIGEADYYIDSGKRSFRDTTIFKYSGMRGSEYNYNGFVYDSPTPVFDNEEPVIITPYSTGEQLVMCDTELYQSIGAVYTPYDKNNNALTYTYEIGAPYSFYINAFDASNRISVVSALNTPSADTFSKRYFKYNTSGQLIEDSLYTTIISTHLEQKYLYSYDASGNITAAVGYTNGLPSGTWTVQRYDSMTYYSDNKLKTFIATDSHGELLENDTLSYIPGNNYPSYIASYGWDNDSGKWSIGDIYTYHFNSNGLPDTVKLQSWDVNDTLGISFLTQQFILYYDSLNNPILCKDLPDSNAYGSIISESYYYYGNYTTTNVSLSSRQIDSIKIYPNPATSQIYINLASAAKNTQVFVNLINANGQLIRTESVPTNSQTWQMSITDLTPGTYFISISDGAGNKLHSQAIIKQ